VKVSNKGTSGVDVETLYCESGDQQGQICTAS